MKGLEIIKAVLVSTFSRLFDFVFDNLAMIVFSFAIIYYAEDFFTWVTVGWIVTYTIAEITQESYKKANQNQQYEK